MFKTSVVIKATTFAILIALVLASLPVANVFAKETPSVLEKNWSQLITNFDTQSINHKSVHKWVEHWLKTTKASTSEKAEVQKHLSICNSAIMSAGTIVSKHAGFDAKGNVIDRAAALKSVKDLRYYLRQHMGSIKNLAAHINAKE